MANKEVILLDVTPTDTGDINVRYVMWFYPPVANQVPLPNQNSQWRGASAQDTANLQSGAVVEEVRSVVFLQTMTIAQMKSYLQQAYTQRNAVRSAVANPNSYYGAFFDGTAWTGV